MNRISLALATTLLALAGWLSPPMVGAAEHQFTIANVDYEGTKLFVPSTIIVRAGDTVKITVFNRIPSDPNQHGFTIPAFDVEEVVTRGESVNVTFEPKDAGLYPIKCHLHAAHVGGQLLVLPAE